VVCCMGIYLLKGGDISLPESGGLDYSQPVEQPLAVEEVQPTRTSRPTLPPAVAGAGDTWTVMLYQDADDKILEKDIYVDLNEAERIGSGSNLNIVAQLDRYRGGFSEDGNWTSARRYFVRQDDNLNAITSDLVMDLGEVNMASGETLVDFVTWAIANYPADKYMLILSDHGVGWPGGWSDASATGGGGQLPLQQVMGDQIYLNELEQALEEIRSTTGIGQFEIIGMDACLMGHIEVMSALAPYARYAVISQEVEPALGWAYASFLNELRNNPGLSGAQVGQLIVDSYIVDDQRILDDAARADLVGRGSPFGSLYGAVNIPSADQVARQMTQNITLTAVDLQALPVLTNSLNQLAYAMQAVNQRGVAQARSYAQSFTSIFGRDVPRGDCGCLPVTSRFATGDRGGETRFACRRRDRGVDLLPQLAALWLVGRTGFLHRHSRSLCL
jgi:hypothetical protein